MGLHKTSMVHGIGAYLEQRGLIGWASEKVASEVYEHIAGQLQGPEQLPAAGLDPVSAYKIAQVITDTHANLARQGFGGDRSLAMQKQAAASNDVETLAIMTAGGLMQKRADAMIMQGGQHTNRAGESPDTLAQLDQMQRPQGQYLTGVGHTDMPDGPSSWSSQPHPIGHTNTVPVSNSITKGANFMGNMLENGQGLNGIAEAASGGWGDVSGMMSKLKGMAPPAVAAPVGAQHATEALSSVQAPLMGSMRSNAEPFAAIGEAAASGGGWGGIDSLGAAINSSAPGRASQNSWLGNQWNQLGNAGRGAVAGGAGGAALGAAGGAAYDEDDRLRGALIGGAGGAALGAGAGAGGSVAYHGDNAVGRAMRQPLLAAGLSGQAGAHEAGQLYDRAMNTPVGRGLSQPILAAGLTGQAAAHELGQGWDSFRAMSPHAQGAVIGGGVGAIGGGVAGGMYNDDNPALGAAGGALAGGLAGAGVGAGGTAAVNQLRKQSSDISELLRKIASGGSLTHSPKNTASDAAKHDELAALDLKNRAEGKYVGVAGHSSFPNVNQDFHVQHMPGAPKTGPSTVSSREIKSASDMSQDEQIFVHLFNKTASEIGPYLPSNMDVDTKVAHIRAAIGLDNAQRVNYLNAIYGQR